MIRMIYSLFLLQTAWHDLRKRQIPIWIFLLFGAVGVCALLLPLSAWPGVRGMGTGITGIAGFLPGIALLSITACTRGQIGSGDGFFFLVSALYLSVRSLLLLLSFGLIFCSAFCLGMVIWGAMGLERHQCEEHAAAVSAVFNSGLAVAFVFLSDSLKGGQQGMDKEMASGKCFSLEGSYTVEAALVMSISLFFIAALLTGIFEVHSRIVGNMVLQEGLEQCIYTEENMPEDLEEKKLQSLRAFFWCGDAALTLGQSGKKAAGHVDTAVRTEIVIRGFDPESFLRMLEAAGV